MDIIIGAGVTGLSYAAFCGHQDYLILESENEVGGFCRTTCRNGFVWDYSGHFFHFRDEKIKKLMMESINTADLLHIVKSTCIKYKSRYIDYPFQKNIHQLSKKELIDCLYDLFLTNQDVYHNFKEMLYAKFGKSIAEKFLIPYNTKLYACDLNTLDKDAMGRFFPYAGKTEIIKNFKTARNSSYNDSFLYSQKGAITYINSILHHVKVSNIRTNCCVISIDKKKQQIKTQYGEILKYDRLISSIPFPNLLQITATPYDETLYNWNKVLVFNLGFDQKGHNTNVHWIYFPESRYCFYRVGFYSNILSSEKMSLYVELGFKKTDKINIDFWLSKVLRDLKKAGIINGTEQLVDHESIIMNPAYVHISSMSIKDVQIKKSLLENKNIYSIGRYGSWTYCSIEDNIVEARDLAYQLNPQKYNG